jgi:hypothetical protein
MVENYVNWTTLKSKFVGLTDLWYADESDRYRLFVFQLDGEIRWESVIFKGEIPYSSIGYRSQASNDSDKSDFESNYKASAKVL